MTCLPLRAIFIVWLVVLFTSCKGDATSGAVADAGEHVGVCRARCSVDADCSVVGAGLRCIAGGCQTALPVEPPCANDGECFVRANEKLSLGLGSCNAPSDCPSPTACVDFDGAPPGQCILPAGPNSLCDPGFSTVDIAGAQVDVCSPVSRCEAGACVACRTDSDCAAPFTFGGPRCSADGRCVSCVEDADCAGPDAPRTAGSVRSPACNPNGACGCAGPEDCGGLVCNRFGGCGGCVDDSDCDDVTSEGGRCIKGACGCRTVDDCTRTPPGNLTFACQ